jgi:hypothetical protein
VHKTDTLYYLANSIVKTARQRELSFDGVKYTQTIEQAARSIKEHNNFSSDICYLTNIILYSIWNDGLKWAEAYLKEHCNVRGAKQQTS